MASEGPPQSEEIVCVRVPCRDGRERVWRAIELLHQEQRQQRQRIRFPAVMVQFLAVRNYLLLHKEL